MAANLNLALAGVVTVDKKVMNGTPCFGKTFGILIFHVTRNKIDFYRPLFPELLRAVASMSAGEVIHVYGVPEL